MHSGNPVHSGNPQADQHSMLLDGKQEELRLYGSQAGGGDTAPDRSGMITSLEYPGFEPEPAQSGGYRTVLATVWSIRTVFLGFIMRAVALLSATLPPEGRLKTKQKLKQLLSSQPSSTCLLAHDALWQ